MLSQFLQFPRTVRLLLLGSFLLTVSRAVTLPYMVIFLATTFGLSTGEIGVILGVSLLIAATLGIYGGHVVDRLPNFPLLASLIAIFSICFLGAAFSESPWFIFILLTIISTTYSIIDTAIKAYFGNVLPIDKRNEAFSLKYTVTNIGFAVGPLLGAYIALQNQLLPFLLSLLFGIVYLVVFTLGSYKDIALRANLTQTSEMDFRATLRTLARDRQLILFTVGGGLSALVFGQFTAYLSQFLIATTDPSFAYQVVAAIVTTNAIVVICSQYLVGRIITRTRLFQWLLGGLCLLIVGEIGFAFANTVEAWIFFMIVFSLGETIIIPAEYSYVDSIAKRHMRGSYFAAQNLTNIGGALGPFLCGLLITSVSPHSIFIMLTAAIFASGLFYYLGETSKVGSEKRPFDVT